MRLAELITPERTIAPLHADTLPSAAAALVERLVAAGDVADAEKLRSRIAEQRPEEIVAMADRAFLLHLRADAVADIVVALGASPIPICRELGDNERQCARIVVLVVAPPRLAARYLQVVGALARLLSQQGNVDALLAHATPETLARSPLFATQEIPEQIAVRDIMTEWPRVMAPDAPLRDAAHDMVRSGIGGMPVVDAEGRVIGLLGEREIMRTLLSRYLQGRAPPPSLPPPTVRDAMTRQVLCVSPEQPVAEVAAVMINKDVDRVPVVSDGRLVGVLSRGDIVRKLIGP